jgi:hypothetical protein
MKRKTESTERALELRLTIFQFILLAEIRAGRQLWEPKQPSHQLVQADLEELTELQQIRELESLGLIILQSWGNTLELQTTRRADSLMALWGEQLTTFLQNVGANPSKNA